MNNNIKIIIGLGNIGNQYIGSRHNIGSDYIYQISKKFNVNIKKSNTLSGYIGKITKHNIILFIPDDFINNSGKSIFYITNFYKINLENILVIHDELDLLPGIAKFKYGGSSGGHNGVQSIINVFKHSSFYRLRIGIGKPNNKNKINNFVLNKPNINEIKNINLALQRSLYAIDILINTNNYNLAMNFLHKKIMD
ncbi:aminoacyl-tRNA hydrolase [Enterobacteriaceae endosymbiont of Neohaemonia nigricornis]|uniref:aminoacyl-tRNA hydrolase n=1 Tax=Enterobacteriaceae endosymbiont of Neohaemonia nigricornis TaxID=2675792 RepID=UPI0014493FE9|nr:aminoacyl-tRNA hydrolase [Enterobacteriaceae endosymbiont of Neohaemonia nigricornis]QJC30301.1 aminoacyl-tRNA hydrolase [Enterobacteriaceae endosymbiont of Neohaemonia nigricornis]